MTTKSMPLGREATVHLTRAIGWMELGNYDEAEAELGNIQAPMGNHPDVLEARLAIFLNSKKWDACVYLAQVILAQDCRRLSAWIGQSYALRRVPNGGVQAAFDALLPAAKHFPSQFIVPFNLACYAAQAGNLDDAELWFTRAMKLAEGDVKANEFKIKALEEPDLEPLWLAKGKDAFFVRGSSQSSDA